MILTRDQIQAHAAGAPLEVPAGTLVTSRAREEAEARGIAIVESGAAPAKCECGGTGGACSCAAPPTARPLGPASASAARPDGPREEARGGADWSARLAARRGVDPSLWRGASPPPPSQGSASSDRRTSAREAESRLLGPADTHVDACAMGGECREDVVVVTAVGRNRPHVLAELAAGIAEVGGDIQEISQRIVDGWFHTILTADMSRAPGAFPEAKEALESLSREDDYTVRVQHERVFRYMHRI